MARVFVGIGSNVSPGVYIRRAIDALTLICTNCISSRIFLSEAVGGSTGTFANLVFGGTTSLAVNEFVAALKAIEKANGRGPDHQTIDLDLLLYDDLVLNNRSVRVPREDIERYVFVLKPLAEIEPEFIHPITGISIGQMWRRSKMDDSGLTEVSLEALEQQ